MDLAMRDKKAIVTGASEGIGKAITRALAREGVDVAICARRKEPLERTAAEIAKESGRKIFPIPADLTKAADAENFVKAAHAALGRIDILINNAGSAPGGVLEHLSEEDWAQALQLKFMGYVRCMKHALPIMQKQKKGRVVNLIGNDGVKVSYWEIAPGAEPALLTWISIRPSAACAALTKFSASAGLVRSAGIGKIFRPVSLAISAAVLSSGSFRRAQIATSAPSRASARAIALPMPSLAPVTIAFLSLIAKSMAHLPSCDEARV